MKKLCHYISEYMGLLVLAAALLAMVFPHTLAQVPTRIINYLLGLVMFGMGLTLNLNDFKIVFSRPKYVMIGCLAQFTVMPLLAWALARLFQLDDALALGVVLVGCCPGGTASNVITYLAKGDLALSVGMTGVSTLLAPFLTPLLTWALAGKSVDVNVASMFLSILWVVIVPIVVGWLVKWLWPKFTESVTDYLPAFSSMAIAFIVAIIIAANHEKLLVGGLLIIVVVMLHNIFGLSIGYLITQKACHLHRGRHAEFWSGQQFGHHPFCRLSPRHHPRSYLQCVAQHLRCRRSLFVSEEGINGHPYIAK